MLAFWCGCMNLKISWVAVFMILMVVMICLTLFSMLLLQVWFDSSLLCLDFGGFDVEVYNPLPMIMDRMMSCSLFLPAAVFISFILNLISARTPPLCRCVTPKIVIQSFTL